MDTITTLTKQLLEQIAPSQGAKYSPNLHKWLRKRRFWGTENTRVYENCGPGYRPGLYIGFKDNEGWFTGCRLMDVLCKGASAETGAYCGDGFQEVPDFWGRYVANGRCAIDPEHTGWFLDDETRWQVDGDTRSCLWCGCHTQRLRRWTEQVERLQWESEQ